MSVGRTDAGWVGRGKGKLPCSIVQKDGAGGDFSLRDMERGREKRMETCEYTVVSIDGDYANLRRLDASEEDLKLVARALLPEEIEEGCMLVYECLEYRMKG